MDMRLPAGPAIARRFSTSEMRFSRHAWWLYLMVMAPIAVAYLAGPLNAGPVFNVIGFSASIAIVVGVRVHKPAARLPWYLLALAQVFFRRGECRLQLQGVVRQGAANPLGRRPVYLFVYPPPSPGSCS